MVSLQRKFAGFAAGLSTADITESLSQALRGRVLDTLAASLCNVHAPYMNGLVKIYGDVPGLVPVWGRRERVRAPHAAFLNGSLAHGTDFDDTQAESGVHASAVQVPVAFAVAVERGATFGDFLLALAAGLEVAIRVGGAPGHGFNDRGFHATPVAGAFGAAVTASRLMGLSEAATADALGLAGSLASGLYQFTSTGGDVKRLHAGWAAQAGYQAARWAAAGLRGPDEIFEGRYGLYKTHLGVDVDYGAIAKGLGSEWRLAHVLAKRYPCCHFLHSVIDCARLLRPKVGDRQVSSVIALVPRDAVGTVCEPSESKRACADPYEAKFSVYYAAAAALAGGDVGLETFSLEAIRRPAVRDRMQSVDYRVEEFASKSYPGGLEIRLSDGMVLRHLLEQPLALDRETLSKKFLASAEGVLRDPSGTAALVFGMEPMEETQRLADGLRAG